MQSADARGTAPIGDGSRGAGEAMALGGLIAAVALFWWWKLLGGSGDKALDAFEYHYPSYLWLYGEIAAGRLPLWNPYQLCGIPALDILQTGALYPLHLLHVLLPIDVAMAASGLLHLLLAAVATWVFARRAGLGPPAALAAALLFATRGAQPGHVTNPSMQEAGAWLAVGFLGVLALARGRTAAGALWIASATGMGLLAGFPQLSVYAAYAWLLVTLGLTLSGGDAWRRTGVALGGAVAGIGLGALLAAVVLVPALDLSAIGGRERGALPLHLMLPFGRAGFETFSQALSSALASRPALPALPFTFGLTGLLLAAVALTGREHRRLAIVMLATAVLALVFAVGPGTPLFDWLLLLPELASFRNPWRVLFVADFAVAVAAGAGLHALLARIARIAARRAPGASDGRAPVVVAAIAIAFVIAEVLIAPGNPRRLPYDAEHPLLSMYEGDRPVLEKLAADPDRVWTFFVGDMGDVSEKLASVYRFRSISDNEILTLRRQRDYFTWLYWGALEPDTVNRQGYSQNVFYGYYSLLAPGIDPAGVAARGRLADLAAARHVLVPRSGIGEPAIATVLREGEARAVDISDPQIVLLERPRALPRAYASHGVAAAPDTAALLAALGRPDFDPRALSYVEADPAALPALEQGSADEIVRITVDEPEEVVVETRLDGRALVVLADTYHPGWRAEIDGEPAPILATNHLFRGVVAPAGEHRIVFRYRPRSVRLGAIGSGVGVVLLGALAWRVRRL